VGSSTATVLLEDWQVLDGAGVSRELLNGKLATCWQPAALFS